MAKEIWEYTPSAGTYSKSYCFFGKDFPVHYLVDSKGSMVRGNDARWYIDWISGLGANLLGYDDRNGFYTYIATKIKHGISYSLPHELEYTVAQKLVTLLKMYVPGWNNEELQVRWVLSGSDACGAAIRLAKAVKQGIVLSSGYHGQNSEFIAATPPAHGLYDIPGVKTFEFDSFPETGEEVSAVIIEVPPVVKRVAYFDDLRRWCDEHNALLIIDEVVTGLRYARGGACELFNIKPDIVCMGKALGGGMPIAAVVAKKELMDWFNPVNRPNNDPVFISSTNSGSLGGLAAANFILDYVENGKYLKHIETIGFTLKNKLIEIGYNVIGNAARNLIIWDNDAHKAFTIRYFFDNGILLNRPNFPNMCHTMENVNDTIEIAKEAMVYWKWINENSPEEVQHWIDNAPITMFRNR